MPSLLPSRHREKDVVFVLQEIDQESLDALLTPIEGVPLPKLTSAKSVECDANRIGSSARLQTFFTFFHDRLGRAHVVTTASLTKLFLKPSCSRIVGESISSATKSP